MDDDVFAKQLAEIKKLAGSLGIEGQSADTNALSALTDVRQRLDNIQAQIIEQSLRSVMIESLTSPACRVLDDLYRAVEQRFSDDRSIPNLIGSFQTVLAMLEAEHSLQVMEPIYRNNKARRYLQKAVTVFDGSVLAEIYFIPDVAEFEDTSSIHAADCRQAFAGLEAVMRGEYKAAILSGLTRGVTLLPRPSGGVDFVLHHEVTNDPLRSRDLLQLGFARDIDDLFAQMRVQHTELAARVRRVYTPSSYKKIISVLNRVPENQEIAQKAKHLQQLVKAMIDGEKDLNDDSTTYFYYLAVQFAFALRLIPLEQAHRWMDCFRVDVEDEEP